MDIQQEEPASPDTNPQPKEAPKRANWVDPAIWLRRDMRTALATHDIAIVYRLLQRYGASQRLISRETEQSQSEVSEILSGRRVASYAVLLRIAKGLGIPRGWMGLEYSEEQGRPARCTEPGGVGLASPTGAGRVVQREGGTHQFH